MYYLRKTSNPLDVGHELLDCFDSELCTWTINERSYNKLYYYDESHDMLFFEIYKGTEDGDNFLILEYIENIGSAYIQINVDGIRTGSVLDLTYKCTDLTPAGLICDFGFCRLITSTVNGEPGIYFYLSDGTNDILTYNILKSDNSVVQYINNNVIQYRFEPDYSNYSDNNIPENLWVFFDNYKICATGLADVNKNVDTSVLVQNGHISNTLVNESAENEVPVYFFHRPGTNVYSHGKIYQGYYKFIGGPNQYTLTVGPQYNHLIVPAINITTNQVGLLVRSYHVTRLIPNTEIFKYRFFPALGNTADMIPGPILYDTRVTQVGWIK